MNEQENKQVIQQMFANFKVGNLPGVVSILSENVIWSVPGPKEIPHAGIRNGPKQVAEFFRIESEAIDIQQVEPRDWLTTEDKVVVLGHAEGRVKTTSCPLDYDWVYVFTLNEGKVVALQEYFDTAAMAAAFRGT